MFYIRFKKKIYWKNERIAHFRSFPLFWWAMWVNRSFRSNQMSDVSESLISLTKNERPWAICSSRSEEMSDVSELLISLTKTERMSELLNFFSETETLIRSFFDKKRVISSEIKWANSQPCLTCMLRTENMGSVFRLNGIYKIWTSTILCML